MLINHYLPEIAYYQLCFLNLSHVEAFEVSLSSNKMFFYCQQVEGVFYVNSHLERLMFEELKQSCRPGGFGGFLPGMKQIGNVAALPG